MTTFFLVRHAVTEHTNVRLSGWTPDVHLTDEGRAQADAVARNLKKVAFKAVYSSPIDRTLETARAVAVVHNLSVTVREDFGEVRYGRWTNRSFKTLTRTKLWSTVQRFPSAVRFPDGETLREVQSRAVSEMEKIRLERPKQKVCIVTHADVIRLIAAHYLGIHIDLFQRVAVGPASTTVISVSDEGPHVLALNIPVRMDDAP